VRLEPSGGDLVVSLESATAVGSTEGVDLDGLRCVFTAGAAPDDVLSLLLPLLLLSVLVADVLAAAVELLWMGLPSDGAPMLRTSFMADVFVGRSMQVAVMAAFTRR